MGTVGPLTKKKTLKKKANQCQANGSWESFLLLRKKLRENYYMAFQLFHYDH